MFTPNYRVEGSHVPEGGLSFGNLDDAMEEANRRIN